MQLRSDLIPMDNKPKLPGPIKAPSRLLIVRLVLFLGSRGIASLLIVWDMFTIPCGAPARGLLFELIRQIALDFTQHVAFEALVRSSGLRDVGLC